jgi:uncharacterized membrane protein
VRRGSTTTWGAGAGFLRGALVGAGLVFWFDPISGRRRRAITRQRLVHAVGATAHEADVAARDASHRAAGLVAAARRWLRPQRTDDTTLKARVQAQIGRATSHPGAIQVACRNGRVELAGVVLKNDMPGLLRATKHVAGVEEVVNCLETRDEPAHMPHGSAGHAHGAVGHAGHAHGRWPPAARLLGVVAGLSVFAHGRRRHGVAGVAEELGGLALLARALSLPGIERFTTLEGEHKGIGLRKTVNVDAPIEEVFALWSRLEAFPRYMAHVKEVRRLDEHHVRWRVAGPAGSTVEWDAEITAQQPNELISWRSVAGSRFENAGRVRFSRNDQGGTRVEIQLSYHPPGGLIGHLVGELFGAGPKRRLDEDLLRFKSLIELGRATGRTGTVTIEEIETGLH